MLRIAFLVCALSVGACENGDLATDSSIPRGPADHVGDDANDRDDTTGGCVVPTIPTTGRPVEILSPSRLAYIASRMPCVGDSALLVTLESADTMWYDKSAIVPAYQDSSGDNVTFPVGMRPNTIDPNLIVTGGHDAFFENIGTFHFPFGRPVGSKPQDLAVVDFWQLPRDGAGELLPAVWWFRQPNGFTWRYEWMFPVGTVFGEAMFLVDDAGEYWPFEFRTRTRQLDGWTADTYRPFPTASDLAEAIEQAQTTKPDWSNSPELAELVGHLKDENTLVAATLSSPKLSLSFEAIEGAVDVLPALSNPEPVRDLLLEQPFTSAKGKAWKQSGDLVAYAPTTNDNFHIVPKGYTGGFVQVSDSSCERCHVDAGRPFKEYHFFVYLYGEIWGGDQVFSWHPFENDRFVDANGKVKNFNHDNREIRADFISGGVVDEYDKGIHGAASYKRLIQPWSDFSY